MEGEDLLVLGCPGGRGWSGELSLEFSQGLGAGGTRPPSGAWTGTRSQRRLGVSGRGGKLPPWAAVRTRSREEGAVAGTVPEPRHLFLSCGLRLDRSLTGSSCLFSTCHAPCSGDHWLGSSPTQGHPHPWTPRCLQLVPGHPFVPPTTTFPSAAQHKALQVGLVPGLLRPCQRNGVLSTSGGGCCGEPSSLYLKYS